MVSRTRSDSSRRSESIPNMLDPDAGADRDDDSGNAGVAPPGIKQRKETKTTLLDLLGITKTMKLNQEHARVLANLKRYQALEKQLDSLNARLDKLIELLTVATGGGQKNLILAAASKADTALDAFSKMLNGFPQNERLTDVQRVPVQRHLDDLKEKVLSFKNIRDVTRNYSEEVDRIIKKLVKKTGDVVSQYDNFCKLFLH
jgi:hypothetical protein